jgi:hypothetical protein
MELRASWIDNADSYFCSACGYECNNPYKTKYNGVTCPNCLSLMNNAPMDLTPENLETTPKKKTSKHTKVPVKRIRILSKNL